MNYLAERESEFFSHKQIDINAFVGTWYIVRTSLDFWKTRTNPTVTYTLDTTSRSVRILDEVRFLNARGNPSTIVGYDVPIHSGGSLFQWQAKAWYLRFLKSAWGVVDHDDACKSWAVTYFSKTVFTAAGMDIYSRTPRLASLLEKQILTTLSTLKFLDPYLVRLFSPEQSGFTE